LYTAKDDSQSVKKLQRKFKTPLDAAAVVLVAGGADAMVAGLTDTTENVILSAINLIGVQDRSRSPSSFFLINMHSRKEEGEYIAFADCALSTAPTSEELADIAIMTANNTSAIFDWTPKVAMLSFSTKGSGEHEMVDKVRIAADIAQTKAPDLMIDGELQADVALNPAIAKVKLPGGSSVAGTANILIFPDINAGNIGYKLVQQFTKSNAYGPILQGFKHNISDLSRGATIEDIIGTAILMAANAAHQKI
jgi:phosphate acetyltransferase